MKLFQQRLKEVRGSLKQSEFAKKLGIKTTAYGHYETGRSEPSLSVILKIVEITGCSVDWLLGIEKTDPAANPRAEEAERRLNGLKKALSVLLKEY